MAAMSPARRARQSAIMRERWATQPDAMAAILAKAQAARVASGRGGWQAYHQAAGHDGGYSAALADGGHDGPYAAVRTLDYWEALYEPPWDIGWDRVQGAGARPAQWPADATLERHTPHVRGQRWAGWVIRRPDDPPDDVAAPAPPAAPAPRSNWYAEFMAQQQREAATAAATWRDRQAARVERERQEAARYAAAWAPRPAALPPPDYTCNGCRQPSWLHGPRPAPGQYTVHCNDCDAYTLIEVG